MEPVATKILLTRLHTKKIGVRVLTTDRSSQIKRLMRSINIGRRRRGLKAIKHCYDCWHMTKAVTKDLFVASKLKKCKTLASWIKSVRNQYWFSFKACKGNALLLREMVLSIPQHVSGVHEFPENKLFKRCLHEELPEDRSKPWLKPGSLSMKKLVAAIRGRKDCRLKDLEMMTEFQHTSWNENINARHNVYLPKSTAFEHPQAVVRACLTAIDHNHNADRKQKKDVDGDSQYEMVSTRDGLDYKERKVMEPKDTTWRKKIFAEVLEVRKSLKMFFMAPTIVCLSQGYFELLDSDP
jgi:hypothetical protein